MRVQRLATMPDPAVVRDALPDESSPIGDENLRRSAPTVEQLYDNDLKPVGAAVEVAYEGVYRVEQAALDNGASLDRDFASIGGWIASTLVRLGDLELEFLPPFDGDTFG